MATTNSRNLELTTVGTNVTVDVTYKAVFSSFERFLAANGLRFEERIRVIGVDPPGGTTGEVLHMFGNETLPVTAGAGPQTIPRNRSITVSRASLNEDEALVDPFDEIRCRIEIVPIGMPASITGFTDQEVLPGLAL
jgi:hypothetical protein